MNPQLLRMLADERMAVALRDASDRRLARRERLPLYEARRQDVALRLDRVSDREALEQLAALSERRLAEGRFVVAEVAGRLVAALPLAEGAPLADPFAATAHLRPLLELRAAQVRGSEGGSRRSRLLRLLPHRA